MTTETLAALRTWLAAQLDWQQTLGLWVLGSLAAGVIGCWLLWLVLKWDARRSGRLAAALDSPLGQLLAWIVRLAWLIGPGYVALLLGILSPRLMGLAQVDWGPGFGYGMMFALLALGILLAAGLSYRRLQPAAPVWPSLAEGLAFSARLLLEAGALQWHWAFYRSAAIVAATALELSQPAYWGTWIGLLLVVLEGVLSPLLWRDLRTPGLAERRALRAVLLMSTSVLYLLSRNFWLAWLLHAVAVLVLEPRIGRPLPAIPGNKKGSQEPSGARQPS